MTQPSASYETDDAAALRAALSVFDDWDSDLTALFLFSKDASTSYGRQAKQIKTADPTVPYKPRRDARKLEIAALRAQVDELETVVALEKALVKQQPPPTDETWEALALRNEWERMANNQHQARLATEIENVKLRELVESQAKNAEQILKLTMRVSELERALPTELPDVSFEDYNGPKVDVQIQLRQLDAMLPRASELFASGSFADPDRGCFYEVSFCEDTPKNRGVGVQFEASWVVPFEIERVADALWLQTIRPTIKHKKSVYMNLHEDSHCVVSQFCSISHKEKGSSQGQVAARRLPRDLGDGSFLILLTVQVRAFFESKWHSSGNVEGWLRIESVASSHREPLTRIKWFWKTLIQPPDVESLSESELGKWISVLISKSTRSKFERDLERSVQALENMLITPKTVA